MEVNYFAFFVHSLGKLDNFTVSLKLSATSKIPASTFCNIKFVRCNRKGVYTLLHLLLSNACRECTTHHIYSIIYSTSTYMYVILTYRIPYVCPTLFFRSRLISVAVHVFEQKPQWPGFITVANCAAMVSCCYKPLMCKLLFANFLGGNSLHNLRVLCARHVWCKTLSI